MREAFADRRELALDERRLSRQPIHYTQAQTLDARECSRLAGWPSSRVVDRMVVIWKARNEGTTAINLCT